MSFKVARDLASRLRLKAYAVQSAAPARPGVARDLASRLRLKAPRAPRLFGFPRCRQGPGISSEIESKMGIGNELLGCGRQGPGISSEIERPSRWMCHT